MNFISIQIPGYFIKSSVALLMLAVCSLSFTGCDSDDPQKEDVPELITKVTLTFTPDGGGTPVVATAADPDGIGVQPLATSGPIVLSSGVSYALELTLVNELANATDPEYDITAEVEEEGDEHMFFYSFTNNFFANPAGNGNVDNRTDAVNYDDKDSKDLPIGLHTSWTVGTVVKSGKFQVLLKHQPDLKNATSTAEDGEDDLNITFDIQVQ
jgi:hypothetical protein